MFKKFILPAAIFGAVFMVIHSKIKNRRHNLPLLGDKAPKFKAKTTRGNINFPSDYKGSWVVFFSHPADFTPVCTTEFMTFEYVKNKFDRLNTKLLGLSVDKVDSHLEWIKDIKENIDYNGISKIDVNFPLIEDADLSIAKKYGMIQPNSDSNKTVRAVFIIDPESRVRAILYYPQTNGRNVDEIIRLLTALQTSDEFKVVTPANWEMGDEVIIMPPSSKEEAEKRLKDTDNTRCYDWFLCFKDLPKETIENKLYHDNSTTFSQTIQVNEFEQNS